MTLHKISTLIIYICMLHNEERWATTFEENHDKRFQHDCRHTRAQKNAGSGGRGGERGRDGKEEGLASRGRGGAGKEGDEL